MTAAAFALAASLLAAGPSTEASDPEAAPEPFADRLLSLHRAGDDAGFNALAGRMAAEDVDALAVVDRLIGVFLEPGGSSDGALAAASRVAARAGTGNRSLEDFVARVAAWSEEEQSREAALRRELERLEASPAGGLAAIASMLEGAPASRTSVLCRLARLPALAAAGAESDAVREIDAAREAARAIGWPIFEARVKRAAADALSEMTKSANRSARPESARRLALLEIPIREELGDVAGTARARMMLGIALNELKDPASLGSFTAAAAAARTAGDRTLLVDAIGNLGAHHQVRGERELAVGAFREALELTCPPQTPDMKRRRGILLGNLGQILQGLDPGEEGPRLLRESIGLLDACGAAVPARVMRARLGVALAARGGLDEALALLRSASAELDRLGAKSEAIVAQRQLASVHELAGDPEAAFSCLKRVIDESERLVAPRQLVLALLPLERTGAKLGRDRDVEELLVRAANACRGRGAVEAISLEALARWLSLRGDAERAVESSEKVLALHESSGDERGAASARVPLARAMARLGRTREALAEAERAVSDLERIGDPSELRVALGVRARLRFGEGDHAGTLEDALAALSTSESLPPAWCDEDAVLHRAAARESVEIGLLAVAALRSRAGSVEDALVGTAYELIENGRAVVLAEEILERLATARTAAALDLIAQAAWMRQIHRQALEALVDRRAAGSAQPAVDVARRDVRDANDSLAKAVAALAASELPKVPKRGEGAAALASLKDRIPADGAFVAYQFAWDRCLALVVTRTSAELVDLGNRSDIERRAAVFAAAAEQPHSRDEEIAASVGAAILGPLEGALAGAGRLLISPDGVLAGVPFEAIGLPGGRPGERVIDRYVTTFVPSGTVFCALADAPRRAARRGKLIVFGNPSPAESLPALPCSGRAARRIAALACDAGRPCRVRTREGATVAELRRSLSWGGDGLYSLVFAGHGTFDVARPRQSALLFAGGERLTVADVQRLPISADLVTIAACESGLGSDAMGEGMVGFARGFLLAGASRVLVSRSRVADDAAHRLLVEFYGRLLAEGARPADALAEARRDVRRLGGRFAHPSAWAPFALWGLP